MSDISIPVEFTSDEKGYYDRQCPNDKCEFVFKIYMEDWCVFRHIRTAKPETSGHRSGNIRTVNRHYPDTLSNEFIVL